MDSLLKIKNLSKSYGENQVLKNINLEIKAGEILGLVGENGAGKSTLMNILFGMEVISNTGGYEGKVVFNGKEVNFKNCFDALESGIGMVHQEFSLIPGFAVYDNIVLNRESLTNSMMKYVFGNKIQTIDSKKNIKRAEESIEKLGISMNTNDLIETMPVAYKQFTEIAREIEREKTKLLILDEPTAVLTEEETKILETSIKNLADKGIAIIFITHRLNEIMRISDKVSIMRDGDLIFTKNTVDTDVNEITEAMVGRTIEKTKNNYIKNKRKTILKLENFYVDMPGETVKNLNLEIKEGEILGLGGMAGQGKIGIANGVMGLYKSYGKVFINDEEITLNKPFDPLNKEIFFVSEDRKDVGLLINDSIEMNIAYPSIQIRNKFLKKKFKFINVMNEDEISKNAEYYIDKLGIKCTSGKQRVSELSGGNQQKVCLAKAFTINPKILFVSEPTRGIDVGAKQTVLQTLREYNKEKGLTIIVTSSELEELRSICDRVAIITDGKVQGILNATDDILEFGKLMLAVSGGN